MDYRIYFLLYNRKLTQNRIIKGSLFFYDVFNNIYKLLIYLPNAKSHFKTTIKNGTTEIMNFNKKKILIT